jgi:hypothetical protein
MSMTWLLANAPGFENLVKKERSAIVDFCLLWSLFEARISEKSTRLFFWILMASPLSA